MCRWEIEEDPTKEIRSDQAVGDKLRAVSWKPSRKKKVSKKRESQTAQNDVE